jgi:hypothetical protein
VIVARSGMGYAEDDLAARLSQGQRLTFGPQPTVTPTADVPAAATETGALAWISANKITVAVGVFAVLGVVWFLRR